MEANIHRNKMINGNKNDNHNVLVYSIQLYDILVYSCVDLSKTTLLNTIYKKFINKKS